MNPEEKQYIVSGAALIIAFAILGWGIGSLAKRLIRKATNNPTDYQLLHDASDCVQELMEHRGYTNVQIAPGGFLAKHKDGHWLSGGVLLVDKPNNP